MIKGLSCTLAWTLQRGCVCQFTNKNKTKEDDNNFMTTETTVPKTIVELCEKFNLKPYCGAGVDDGWIPLLDKLVTDLVASGWNSKDCAQIKEKFGGLRFYVEEATPEQYDMISAAEGLSFKTCEMCSAPGKRQSIKGWLKTVCEQCHEDFLKPTTTNKG